MYLKALFKHTEYASAKNIYLNRVETSIVSLNISNLK